MGQILYLTTAAAISPSPLPSVTLSGMCPMPAGRLGTKGRWILQVRKAPCLVAIKWSGWLVWHQPCFEGMLVSTQTSVKECLPFFNSATNSFKPFSHLSAEQARGVALA